MMTRNGIVSVLVVSATAWSVGGCAQPTSRLAAARRGSTTLYPVSDAVIARAPEARPPKILPNTHFSAARLFEGQGDLGKAVIQYRKAIALNHSYVEAYHRLALVLSALNRREEALDALQRAVQLAPDNVVLRNNFGFELMLSQRWSAAVQQFERAIAVKPSFARAYVNLGLALSKLNRFDDALVVFRTVLPDKDAYYNMGLMYRGQRRYQEAAGAFEHVLGLDPEFTAARKQLEQLARHLDKQHEPADKSSVSDASNSRFVTEPYEPVALPAGVRTGESEPPTPVHQDPLRLAPAVANRATPAKGAWDDAFDLIDRAFEEACKETERQTADRATVSQVTEQIDSIREIDIDEITAFVDRPSNRSARIARRTAQTDTLTHNPRGAFPPLPPRAPTRVTRTQPSTSPTSARFNVTTPGDAEVMTIRSAGAMWPRDDQVASAVSRRSVNLVTSSSDRPIAADKSSFPRRSTRHRPIDDRVRVIDVPRTVTNAQLNVQDPPFFGGAPVCTGDQNALDDFELEYGAISFADEVLGISPGDIDYRLTLPPADPHDYQVFGADGESTVDSWALLAQLEQSIAIVRNELDCLSGVDDIGSGQYFALEGEMGPPIPPHLRENSGVPHEFITPQRARLVSDKRKAQENARKGRTKSADKSRRRSTRDGRSDTRRKNNWPRTEAGHGNLPTGSSDWRREFRVLEDLMSIATNELQCATRADHLQVKQDHAEPELQWLFRTFEADSQRKPSPVEAGVIAPVGMRWTAPDSSPRDKTVHEIRGAYGHQRESLPD